MSRNWKDVQLFSPAAIGTPVPARSRAIAEKSSGGKIGSSSQCRSYGRSFIVMWRACSGVHGQLVSTMMATPSPAASRAARTSASSVSCSLM